MGFASETKEGYLANIVIKKTYYNKDIFHIIIQKICNEYRARTGKAPQIKVNSKIMAENEMIPTYLELGFRIKSKGDIIILEFIFKNK